MQVEVPDTAVEALRQALIPILERLIDEWVEQKRTLLLSVTDVAEELSCSRASVFGLIHGGHLEAVRMGRTYRVATRTLEAYAEELTKPSYGREVVSTQVTAARQTLPTRSAVRATGVRVATPSVVLATKPPRPPRPTKEKRPSKAEIAEGRWTVAEFAGRWWGMESAKALIDRSGVELREERGGVSTFRYGDLLEWTQRHAAEFEQWNEEFDPVLGGRGSAQPKHGASPAGGAGIS